MGIGNICELAELHTNVSQALTLFICKTRFLYNPTPALAPTGTAKCFLKNPWDFTSSCFLSHFLLFSAWYVKLCIVWAVHHHAGNSSKCERKQELVKSRKFFNFLPRLLSTCLRLSWSVSGSTLMVNYHSDMPIMLSLRSICWLTESALS